MITVRIGNEERDFKNADEQWINQQINNRRAAGETVCVRVTVHQDDLDMTLSTPTCLVGGIGRPATNHEKQILDLWRQRGLDDRNFTGGNLVAFLKQLNKFL